MITNKGKEIIAKYLLGQAVEYSAYIAAGSGQQPLYTSASPFLSASALNLNFEMFRSPVIARGLVKEGNTEKLVFKAEMPTEQKYQITEIALYSDESNALAGQYDSKFLSSFLSTEPWIKIKNNIGLDIPFVTTNITDALTSNILPEYSSASTENGVFFIDTTQSIFSNQIRQERYEPTRYLNRCLMVRGDSASVDASFSPSASSQYIENRSVSINLLQNLTNDKIRLAFSLVSVNYDNASLPAGVRILLEFINNPFLGTSNQLKAKTYIDLLGSNFTSSRYIVVEKSISDFIADTGFNWSNINVVRIHTCVHNNGAPTNNYFIAYDGIRFENITTKNPLYGMVAYSVIQNNQALPIIKKENTTNYIEYRLAIGVE